MNKGTVVWGAGIFVVVAGAVWLSVIWPLIAGLIIIGVITALIVAANFPRLIWVFLAVGLAAAAGAGVRFISASSGALNYSDLRYLTSVIAVLLSLSLLTKVLPVLAKELVWLLLLVYALISLAWVPDVSRSLMTYSGWVCVALLGAVLAARYGRVEASKLVLNVMFCLSAASLAFIVLLPSAGRVQATRPDGVVEAMPAGVFAWNSELSLVSGVGTVLALGFWLSARRNSHLVQAGLMAGLTILSDSATGIFAMVAGVFATLWACVPKLRALIIVLLGVAAVLWATGGIDALTAYALSIVGRTPNLSGRSVIWQLALGLASERPSFGYGIGGTPDLSQYLGFSAHAHNGYIQLLLELGFVGAGIFGLGLVITTVRGLRLRSPLLGVLAVVLVSNLANNYLVTSNVAVALLSWVAFEMAKPRDVVWPVLTVPMVTTQKPERAAHPNPVSASPGAVRQPS